jgi:hypothetical protein
MFTNVRRLCAASSVALGFAWLLMTTTPLGAAADVLSACINSGNGMMRLVTASEPCHANETRVSWNSEGPAGPPGPTGPVGPTGPTGPSGSGGGGGPYVWVCTPVSFLNAGGNVNTDINVFNASASTANVAINILDANGSNLAGITIPGSSPLTPYPGDSGLSTVAVLPGHSRRVKWPSPETFPDPSTNVAVVVRVTSDQPISVGSFIQWSGFVQLPCSFVHQ